MSLATQVKKIPGRRLTKHSHKAYPKGT